jgi:predicted RNA-binding Zn-ribbon protein involved in translation (DUF1610 family)
MYLTPEVEQDISWFFGRLKDRGEIASMRTPPTPTARIVGDTLRRLRAIDTAMTEAGEDVNWLFADLKRQGEIPSDADDSSEHWPQIVAHAVERARVSYLTPEMEEDIGQLFEHLQRRGEIPVGVDEADQFPAQVVAYALNQALEIVEAEEANADRSGTHESRNNESSVTAGVQQSERLREYTCPDCGRKHQMRDRGPEPRRCPECVREHLHELVERRHENAEPDARRAPDTVEMDLVGNGNSQPTSKNPQPQGAVETNKTPAHIPQGALSQQSQPWIVTHQRVTLLAQQEV